MKPTDRIAFVLGTWFGCGLSKVAPGTVGSFGALPLHFALCRLGFAEHAGAVVAISLLGIWASHRVSVVLGQKDPQRVVIDEVAGVLIAMGAVRSFGPLAISVAFALFRLFDITKPGPVGRAEHLSPAGLGIMADDLVAGVLAAIVTRVGLMIVFR